MRYIDEFTPPIVYNWSLGVQRAIGLQLVADIAYVGNAARDQLITMANINGRPYGYAYQPSSLDSTVVSGGQAQPLPNDLLRPYQGYGSITQRTFEGYGDYHSLQVSMNRRRTADGLSFGVAYTDSSRKDLGTIDPYVSDNRASNYTLNGSRPHNLVVNYTYEIPNLSQKWDNVLVKALADNWQVSGITSIQSSTKQGFSYGYTNVPTGVLSGTGGIDAAGAGPTSSAIRTFHVATAGSTSSSTRRASGPRPTRTGSGTRSATSTLGPGFMNWDFTFFKVVPMGGTRRLQFRLELYNAFDTISGPSRIRARSSTMSPVRRPTGTSAS